MLDSDSLDFLQNAFSLPNLQKGQDVRCDIFRNTFARRVLRQF